jgi:glutamate N-acetyltransferase/amino-acid N-acetyltransferase
MPTAIKGFKVSAVDAGLRAHFGKTPAPDLTLIAAEQPCTAAGVFTTNLVKAAPVLFDQAQFQAGAEHIRAVLINTASANACTGDQGLQNAKQAAVWLAESLGCDPGDVLLMSTGVIGTQLPMEALHSGITQAVKTLQPEAWPAAAQAIMTTDTRPKLIHGESNGVHFVGMAKGAGMIAPNMATMLALIVTDAVIAAPHLQTALAQAAEETFNRIVIDGDMSTNDTLLALANGTSGVPIGGPGSESWSAFLATLTDIARELATAIVKDGEGATKFIALHVTGARTAAEAKQIANTIATSPLVKTAFYGGDANWGRILAAAGRSGVKLEQNRLSLWYDSLQLVANGTPLNYDDAQANAIATQPEITVKLDLGLGQAEATLWTCDLSHDYVDINGHYRT